MTTVKRISKHGEWQRQRLLTALGDQALSAEEIGNLIHLCKESALGHLKYMRNETPKRIYIKSYRFNSRSKPTPLYAAGSAPDVEYTAGFGKESVHQIQLSKLVAELEKNPRTNREIAEIFCLSVSGARNLLVELKEMGWCHIGSWSPAVNRNSAPVFHFGPGKDKKRTKKTRAQYWKEEKADKDLHEIRLARRRSKSAVSKIANKPQGIFAALGI